MANIINIETSSKVCSVALSKEGAIEMELEDNEGMNHAIKLAPFVERCMEELKRKGEQLDAVAVSLGPGSYTGLRIGLSLAKGLSFSLNVPLIGLSTLQILAVKAMFRNMQWEGDEIILGMIDARRMEVFAGAYNFALEEIISEGPEILTRNSFSSLHDYRKIIILGDGSEKFRDLYSGINAEWLGGIMPHARDMIALSEKHFREGKFIDLAYSTPNYLKEYQTSLPKNKVLKTTKPTPDNQL
ncbi:MAG: tRNA (adenosine(37)-N6)-threonylcarbamoyltransferase complex dimerization subunit type 1 TsaB [Muribaculaceae bacterium]|nr:tRNA (adenosine(37)-N6)-threonylcarbamoyltransferase complex dimerization subunit type 1 TsaB [Muribaculaceae bacterium]